MVNQTNFSLTYSDARNKFLESAKARGAYITSLQHPTLTGPDGEALYLDCALVGPSDSENILLVLSGTHGIEGFAGSAAQTTWLQSESSAALPEHTAVLLMHAINPWGFAHKLRANEENVDLNRNFIDHQQPYPPNTAYAKVHQAIDMVAWDEPSIAEVFDKLKVLKEELGEQGFSDAFNGGQYTHPDGFFFGGQRVQWSNKVFHEALRLFVSKAKHVALVDFHTGIGPFLGHVFLCFHEVDSAGYKRAQAWWGDRAVNREGVTHKAVAKYQGLLVDALVNALPHAETTAVVVEFGTKPREQMQRAHLGARWLLTHSGSDPALTEKIKSEYSEAFYPDDPEWRNAVLSQSQGIIAQALTGISNR